MPLTTTSQHTWHSARSLTNTTLSCSSTDKQQSSTSPRLQQYQLTGEPQINQDGKHFQQQCMLRPHSQPAQHRALPLDMACCRELSRSVGKRTPPAWPCQCAIVGISQARSGAFWGDREGDLVWKQMRSRPLVRKRLMLLLPAI